MKRLALTAAVALALSASAGAQTFRIVPNGLPSAEAPNAPGSIVVPQPLSAAPAQPAVLSYDELLTLWRGASDAYGVPWEVLAAINKIESNFGGNMGPSSAGALGWMQFIPDSWMRWGVDADADGVADPWDPDDAIYAAARYLAAAGAHDDLARAVYAYNHAQWYVDEVLDLADLFASGDTGFGAFDFGVSGATAVFRADEIEQRLASARRRVTAAKQAIPRVESALEQLEWKTLELEQRAGDPDLSDAAFRTLERRIARLDERQDRIRQELERDRAALDYAVSALDNLRAEAALSPPAALGAAYESGGYVFPVGGGADVVSVAHEHHDYPAADIAAPEGSPLYALADSVVVDAYPDENGKCGIGLRLELESGAVYVYCHLAYLEPSVVPGAALSAGAPVGLVGSTGNSTGPHLHLAFDPAVAYPQQEPWFQSFAGSAFSWQDAPTPEAAPRGGPVFHVVERQRDGLGDGVITFTR